MCETIVVTAVMCDFSWGACNKCDDNVDRTLTVPEYILFSFIPHELFLCAKSKICSS